MGELHLRRQARPSRLKWLAPVVGVHVVLAALAVGALALWGSGAHPAGHHARVTLPDPDPRRPELTGALSIVRPPGTVVLDASEKEAGTPTREVLPALEAEVLARHGVNNVKAIVTRDGGLTQGVWQFTVPDRASPHDASLAIDELYAAGDWKADSTNAPPGVLVRWQPPTERQPLLAYRAHYVTGRHVIRVEAYGPGADRAFAELLDRQLSSWPAEHKTTPMTR